MSPGAVEAEHTSRDLFRWTQFFEEEVNDFDKFNWYAAKVCYWLFALPMRVWGVKVPDDVTEASFLTKFTVGGKKAEDSEESTEEARRKADVEIAKQKAMLMATPAAVAAKRAEFLKKSKNANKGATKRPEGAKRESTRPNPGSAVKRDPCAFPKVVPLPVAPRKGQRPQPE